MSETQPDVLDRALTQFDEIASTQLPDRAASLEDRRFVFVEGAQWDGDWGAQFENSIKVQANKAQRGHDKIINDYRANRFTVNFRPVGDDGDDDTAELLNGLFYADMYHSKGQQALDNAFGEGSAGGFGALRLMNEYEDDSDPDNDHQRIGMHQIVDADQRVFFDPDAKLYDKSDARYCYVMNSITPAGFKREYGDEAQATWPESGASFRYGWRDWFGPEVIYVAEYYEVEEPTEELRIFKREATGEEFRHWAKDMPEGMEADYKKRGFERRTRKIKRRRVHKWILSGAEVLEDCGYIAGPNIPVIPFYGKRVFIDNVERFKGHVRDAKDLNRVYNAQLSKLVETASLAPREVPVFAPEQMDGLQDHWANMNMDRHPYGLAHPLLDPQTGSIVATGPVAYIKPPDLPPVLASLIQLTGTDIAEITNGDDGSMEVKSNVSAQAMDIAASRVDAKSYIYMDNFKQTVTRIGEVYYGMAKEVYVEEGRVVDKMDEDGVTEKATLSEFYMDPKTKISAKRHDLSEGKFNVVADVTEATATRRDKTVRTMLTMAEAAATVGDLELGKACLITAIQNMDGEGMAKFKTYIHKLAVSLGLDEMTPEEQAEAQQAAAQPDPAQQLIASQTAALTAQANKDQTSADLDRAKIVDTLASAQKKAAETEQIDATPPPVQDVNALMQNAA